MDIAIYGAGEYGEYIIQEIQNCKNAKVRSVVFIDNNNIYFKTIKCGIPVVNVELFKQEYFEKVDGVLIAASKELVAQEMVLSLMDLKSMTIYLTPNNVYFGRLPILNDEGEFMSYIKEFRLYKPVLSYLEYHVSDYCNLKCKGCGHFSNLVSEKVFPDINEFRENLSILSDKFRNIKKIRFMGGEPFINRNLYEFIIEAKKIYPYSDLRIVTNGLLFPKIDEKNIKAIRECNVVVDISQYPITRKMIESIIIFAEENQIKISIGKQIVKFMKQLTIKENKDYEGARQKCMSSTCHFLRGTRLYPCAAMLFYENKEFLGLNVSEELLNRNSIDMINCSEDGWDILKKITTPSEFCKYCSSEIEWFEWSPSNESIRKEDWIVKEN